MQSRWENYCRIIAELSQFRAKHLYFTESVKFLRIFGLIAKCERELG